MTPFAVVQGDRLTEPGTLLPSPGEAQYRECAAETTLAVLVPNVTGMTLADAQENLSVTGLRMSGATDGAGSSYAIVIDQKPPAGAYWRQQ